MAKSSDPILPPIRIVTRQLAAMQTGIVAAGVRLFEGGLTRFVIFTLIVRQSLPAQSGEAGAPISIHALANSLSHPYETVRRHVLALIDRGLCVRSSEGVRVSTESLLTSPWREATQLTHDHFVRFVEDLAALGVPMPKQRSTVEYSPVIAIQAAADTMLAVADTNRGVHRDWVDLVIFSTILCANSRRYASDRILAQRYADQTQCVPYELQSPVRPSTIARVIGLPESTVRRHAWAMEADGRLERTGAGLLVSQDWLNLPECVATSTASYANIKRILERVAAAGFPFSSPATAYLQARPGDVAF